MLDIKPKEGQGERSMRAVQALVLVSASLGALTGAAAWGESLTLGNEGTYPPFSMIEADGTLKGLEPELARAMCERLRAECQIQAMDFNALLPSLVSGKIDMIASQLWPTPERLEKAEFTDPVLFNPNAFIVQKSWDKGYSPQDMAGKKVAVIQGSSQAKFLRETYPDLELVAYDNPDQMQLDLLAGRVDAAFGAKLNWIITLIDKPEGADWKVSDENFWDTGEPVGLSWAAEKGNTELVQRVNGALESLLQDCTYTEIRRQYFSQPTSPREPENCM
jgi:arginine/ornithine transport system substrate-binding protein